MELSSTAKVILGMLSVEPMSGYDIKSIVDGSTRFFWAASYGQIYPELRRLTEAGLIEGETRSTGGRRRTVHRLTAAGRDRLEGWLESPHQTFELRHEALLALFFSDPLPAAGRAEQMRRLAAAELERMRKLERIRERNQQESATASSPPVPGLAGGDSPRQVLEFGIELHRWIADWWRRRADELEAA